MIFDMIARRPTYNRNTDGDVFKWILEASQVYRELKQQERVEAIKKLKEKPKMLTKEDLER